MKGSTQSWAAVKRTLERLQQGLSRRTRHYFLLRRAGPTTYRRLEENRYRNLLIVCHGNIYRSAYVAADVRKRLGGRCGIEVKSAGFHPVSGRPCPDRHVRLSAELGIDLRAHRSAIVTQTLVDWADGIVIMDCRNWEHLQALAPEALEKVLWLGVLAGEGSREIEDPYGRDETEMRRILKKLSLSSDRLAQRLGLETTEPGAEPTTGTTQAMP